MLGSSLCQIYQKTHEVYALHRDFECYSSCTADFSLNLLDSTKLHKVFDQINPNLVVHCAGLTSVDECEKRPNLAYENNVAITENIARFCSKGTKLIFISTDQVYGEVADHSETNFDLQPVNQYGKTNYLGEQKCVEHSPDCIILRTNIFGWNVKPSKVSSAEWIYYSLKNGKEITLFTDYVFSPIYTECLGEIILYLVNIRFSGIINVGSPTPSSKYEFGYKLAEESRFDHALINKGLITDHNFVAPRIKSLTLNTQKLAHLGIIAPDYGKSIKKFRQSKLGL